MPVQDVNGDDSNSNSSLEQDELTLSDLQNGWMNTKPSISQEEMAQRLLQWAFIEKQRANSYFCKRHTKQ